MFHENLIQLRKLNGLTQEDLAEKVGVTRQSIAKWEAGQSQPDLERACLLAEALGVTLDDLAHFDPSANLGLSAPPKGKHIFGVVSVGDKGQIVIPARARKVFAIAPGDRLLVLGDETQGIAILKEEEFLRMAEQIRTPEGGNAQ